MAESPNCAIRICTTVQTIGKQGLEKKYKRVENEFERVNFPLLGSLIFIITLDTSDTMYEREEKRI